MKPYSPILALVLASSVHAAKYFVATNGDDAAVGSVDQPFQTIQRAAELAQPGDVVTVREGIYRERVNPKRGGNSEDQRIVYRAASVEEVVIKGSEVVTGWEPVEANVWKLTLANDFFGDFNPFDDRIRGAWFAARQAWHSGAVYLNGHWLKQTARKDQVLQSLLSDEANAEAEELMNVRALAPGYAFGVHGKEFTTEWVDKSEGIRLAKDEFGNDYVTGITDGSYVAYKIDYESPSNAIMIKAASPLSGGFIELRSGSVDGDLLGKFDVQLSANWFDFQSTYTSNTKISGAQTIYCVFKARPIEPMDPAKYVGWWYADVDETTTTIWADFKGVNPNDALTEVNVREAVFYPEEAGLDYITVQGFTLEQAATNWASASAEQIGLIGTHWSKGWIIEDNIIRYSVGTGLTLGKFSDAYDETYDYSGIVIPNAVKNGWTEIGYHQVLNNHISHCGKNGIHGSLGAPYSTIIGNTIHDIRQNHEFLGADTAGLKILGAVDVLIKDNHIYNCEKWGGIWLDWMAQGARVSGNLLHDNYMDILLEVNHGPHLIDNNLFLSETFNTDASGGGAYVHNLWRGRVNIWADQKTRKTPYFKPHSLNIVALTDIDQHDDRFFNNIYVGWNGTSAYDVHAFKITARGNVYTMGAKPTIQDEDVVIASSFDPRVELRQEGDRWWLELEVNPAWQTAVQREMISSKELGRAQIPDAPFEQRDGSTYRLDQDYFGQLRDVNAPTAGPFDASHSGPLRLKVWPK